MIKVNYLSTYVSRANHVRVQYSQLGLVELCATEMEV